MQAYSGQNLQCVAPQVEFEVGAYLCSSPPNGARVTQPAISMETAEGWIYQAAAKLCIGGTSAALLLNRFAKCVPLFENFDVVTSLRNISALYKENVSASVYVACNLDASAVHKLTHSRCTSLKKSQIIPLQLSTNMHAFKLWRRKCMHGF